MRSFFAAILAVLSAFIGIRKRGSPSNDQSIKPVHIVIAGLLCVAVLVISLITLVRFVLSSASV
jgi:Protein of unknown function (DUF2970)